MEFFQPALSYLSNGISVLPAIPSEKRPALPGWRAFQSARPGEAQLRTWFAEAEGMCLVCGAVSGNVEMIDFDHGGELFPAWWETVEANRPGLFEKLVIEETPSGGYHVAYRCDAPVPGNRKLARRILPFDGSGPNVAASGAAPSIRGRLAFSSRSTCTCPRRSTGTTAWTRFPGGSAPPIRCPTIPFPCPLAHADGPRAPKKPADVKTRHGARQGCS